MSKTAVKISLIAALLLGGVVFKLRVDTMPQINFDIAQNIHETARKSGAPRYATSNVVGRITYSLIDLPLDIPARYVRAGFEVEAVPLYALTLYADEEHNNGLLVEKASLQFSPYAAKSHTGAQAFVTDLISQFQNGKWKRYINERCPAVTGRSSFLNEAGQVERIGICPLDPEYRLTEVDWITLMSMPQIYQWIGDGVLATLTVRSSDDIRGVTYSIDLEFEDFEITMRRNQETAVRERAEGDAKGWGSTAEYERNKLAVKALVTLLEQNALKRGDRVIPR